MLRTACAQFTFLSALLLLTSAGHTQEPKGFADPAPPKVETPSPMAPPEAKTHPGLKFHAAPKPLAPGAVTHDWRTFLGPTRNAISSETLLLPTFDKNTPRLVWEVPKGAGYATPAVVGERVVLFHRVGGEEVVECLQAETGKRFWKHAYPTTYTDRYGFSGGPRCQPLSDGERIYTLGAEGKLYCLLLTTGQVLWKRDLLTEFKIRQNFFGVGATPLLEGEHLIINLGAPGGPCVAAFDRKTGRMVWGAGKEWSPGYASPVPATVHGRRRVFVFTGGESRPSDGGLLCIDPANGEVEFTFPWRGRRFESVNASSPVVIGNQVFISECYGPGGVLLELLPEKGYKKVWETEALRTHFMTAIHKDGYLYGIDGHGPRNAPLVCLDLKTGKAMWRTEPDWEETVSTPQGERKFNLFPGLAAMLLVDGRCLMLGEFGHLAWLDLNPNAYRERSRTRLFLSSETWGMPALSRGLLYVCQNNETLEGTPPRLLCYDLRAEKK